MKQIIEQLVNGTAQVNLSVGGYLDLRGAAITSLPEGLSVGGEITGFIGN